MLGIIEHLQQIEWRLGVIYDMCNYTIMGWKRYLALQ